MRQPNLREIVPLIEPKAAANAAALRYVSDKDAGLTRRRCGLGFTFVDVNGKAIRNASTLARIRALVIPPAWTDVWICPEANGHLQVTGRDARGRKQYLYHTRWHSVRNETKYHRTLLFGACLPGLRRRVARDLRLPGLPKNKVLATVVRLLESTLVRIGNDEYARENGSFGITTIRKRHVRIVGSSVAFKFRGKSAINHFVEISDPRLAKVVRKCRELPGQELFAYVDESGFVHDIHSTDVNAYLQEATGGEFTAKDFRTWAGTLLAAECLLKSGHETSPALIKRRVAGAIKSVAKSLHNTPAVCRRCYVHPALLEAYEAGTLGRWFMRRRPRCQSSAGLRGPEAALLALLKQRAVPMHRRKRA